MRFCTKCVDTMIGLIKFCYVRFCSYAAFKIDVMTRLVVSYWKSDTVFKCFVFWKQLDMKLDIDLHLVNTFFFSNAKKKIKYIADKNHVAAYKTKQNKPPPKKKKKKKKILILISLNYYTNVFFFKSFHGFSATGG